MTVTQRAYTSEPGFTEDYLRVRDFLLRINAPVVTTPGFLWARWEWAFSLPYQRLEHLDRIGVWEEDGRVVALATYEMDLGDAYLVVDPAHPELKEAAFTDAVTHLARDGQVRVLIPDADAALQEIAFAEGYRPTQGREWNSVLRLGHTSLEARLPEGFRLVSLADEPDIVKYAQVLWRGFDHEPDEGPMPTTQAYLAEQHRTRSGPGYQPELNVAVMAPDGRFAAYCGMWHFPGTTYALVEPVATDPDFRRMGLGRAAVLDAIRRCGERGVTEAWVGASMPFYYAIGFRPATVDTWWARPAPRTDPAVG